MLAALEAAADPTKAVVTTTASEVSGGFGATHRETFDSPDGLSKKKRKQWPNAFAREVARGQLDESSVRRAIAHLRAHGGSDGHVRVILEAYGMASE